MDDSWTAKQLPDLSGKVAVVTGATGGIGGPLARVRDGDLIRLDATAGTLQVLLDEAQWAAREVLVMPEALRLANGLGMGRELFAGMRRNALTAEAGACSWS